MVAAAVHGEGGHPAEDGGSGGYLNGLRRWRGCFRTSDCGGASEVVTSWSVSPLRPFGAPPPEGEVLVPGGGGFGFCALLLRFLFVVRIIGLGILRVVGVFGLELVCGLFVVTLGWFLWLW